MTDAPYAFILSWERPIFLWACLDSLYRNTRKELRFVLVDNNSQDPLVRYVIQGFEKRGMFEDVLLCSENDPHRMNKIFATYADRLGPYFYFVENDVTVPVQVCWASEYAGIYDAYPGTAMVGSFCDPADFISPTVIGHQDPNLSKADVEFYAKANSPERRVDPDPATVVWPHDRPVPPGRLTLLSTEAIREIGFHPDAKLAPMIGEYGYRYRVCTTFRHRHLSLLNWYDTPDPDYQRQRTEFFRVMSGRPGQGRLSRYLEHKMDRLRTKLLPKR